MLIFIFIYQIAVESKQMPSTFWSNGRQTNIVVAALLPFENYDGVLREKREVMGT